MRITRSCFLVASTLAVYACSSSDGDHDEEANGSGGSAQGSGGEETGDGDTGGESASGGRSSSGGASASGGSGGKGTGGAEASGGSEMGGEGPGGAPGSGGESSEETLDDCFDGLHEAVGSFQDATKESSDGEYRLRLALETGDNFGTSGSYPWQPMRLAIQTPEGVICVDDSALLKQGYTTTHHNCDDTLVVMVGTARYEIQNPDSASDYVDPEAWRRPSTLTIYESDVAVGDPIRLDTVSCNDTSFEDGLCRSGGPC